jgi:hypothetical protein
VSSCSCRQHKAGYHLSTPYRCFIYSCCPEMLKQGNFHIHCLFYVLVRLMNGQEVKITNPFSNVPFRSIPYRKFSIAQRMKFKQMCNDMVSFQHTLPFILQNLWLAGKIMHRFCFKSYSDFTYCIDFQMASESGF